MKYDATRRSLLSLEYTTIFPYYYRRASNAKQKHIIKDQHNNVQNRSWNNDHCNKKSNTVGF
jgi:hypothetical protein